MDDLSALLSENPIDSVGTGGTSELLNAFGSLPSTDHASIYDVTSNRSDSHTPTDYRADVDASLDNLFCDLHYALRCGDFSTPHAVAALSNLQDTIVMADVDGLLQAYDSPEASKFDPLVSPMTALQQALVDTLHAVVRAATSPSTSNETSPTTTAATRVEDSDTQQKSSGVVHHVNGRPVDASALYLVILESIGAVTQKSFAFALLSVLQQITYTCCLSASAIRTLLGYLNRPPSFSYEATPESVLASARQEVRVNLQGEADGRALSTRIQTPGSGGNTRDRGQISPDSSGGHHRSATSVTSHAIEEKSLIDSGSEIVSESSTVAQDVLMPNERPSPDEFIRGLEARLLHAERDNSTEIRLALRQLRKSESPYLRMLHKLNLPASLQDPATIRDAFLSSPYNPPPIGVLALTLAKLAKQSSVFQNLNWAIDISRRHALLLRMLLAERNGKDAIEAVAKQIEAFSDDRDELTSDGTKGTIWELRRDRGRITFDIRTQTPKFGAKSPTVSSVYNAIARFDLHRALIALLAAALVDGDLEAQLQVDATVTGTAATPTSAASETPPVLVSGSRNHGPPPSAYFSSTGGTPLSPVLLQPPSSEGYAWSCWVFLPAPVHDSIMPAETPQNLVAFGAPYGVAFAITKSGTLVARIVAPEPSRREPYDGEGVKFYNLAPGQGIVIPSGRWCHITVSHRPAHSPSTQLQQYQRFQQRLRSEPATSPQIQHLQQQIHRMIHSMPDGYMRIYVDGQLRSVASMPYPISTFIQPPAANTQQPTSPGHARSPLNHDQIRLYLGGFRGAFTAFYFFERPVLAHVPFTLYQLGPGKSGEASIQACKPFSSTGTPQGGSIQPPNPPPIAVFGQGLSMQRTTAPTGIAVPLPSDVAARAANELLVSVTASGAAPPQAFIPTPYAMPSTPVSKGAQSAGAAELSSPTSAVSSPASTIASTSTAQGTSKSSKSTFGTFLAFFTGSSDKPKVEPHVAAAQAAAQSIETSVGSVVVAAEPILLAFGAGTVFKDVCLPSGFALVQPSSRAQRILTVDAVDSGGNAVGKIEDEVLELTMSRLMTIQSERRHRQDRLGVSTPTPIDPTNALFDIPSAEGASKAHPSGGSGTEIYDIFGDRVCFAGTSIACAINHTPLVYPTSLVATRDNIEAFFAVGGIDALLMHLSPALWGKPFYRRGQAESVLRLLLLAIRHTDGVAALRAIRAAPLKALFYDCIPASLRSAELFSLTQQLFEEIQVQEENLRREAIRIADSQRALQAQFDQKLKEAQKEKERPPGPLEMCQQAGKFPQIPYLLSVDLFNQVLFDYAYWSPAGRGVLSAAVELSCAFLTNSDVCRILTFVPESLDPQQIQAMSLAQQHQTRSPLSSFMLGWVSTHLAMCAAVGIGPDLSILPVSRILDNVRILHHQYFMRNVQTVVNERVSRRGVPNIPAAAFPGRRQSFEPWKDKLPFAMLVHARERVAQISRVENATLHYELEHRTGYYKAVQEDTLSTLVSKSSDGPKQPLPMISTAFCTPHSSMTPLSKENSLSARALLSVIAHVIAPRNTAQRNTDVRAVITFLTDCAECPAGPASLEPLIAEALEALIRVARFTSALDVHRVLVECNAYPTLFAILRHAPLLEVSTCKLLIELVLLSPRVLHVLLLEKWFNDIRSRNEELGSSTPAPPRLSSAPSGAVAMALVSDARSSVEAYPSPKQDVWSGYGAGGVGVVVPPSDSRPSAISFDYKGDEKVSKFVIHLARYLVRAFRYSPFLFVAASELARDIRDNTNGSSITHESRDGAMAQPDRKPARPYLSRIGKGVILVAPKDVEASGQQSTDLASMPESSPGLVSGFDILYSQSLSNSSARAATIHDALRPRLAAIVPPAIVEMIANFVFNASTPTLVQDLVKARFPTDEVDLQAHPPSNYLGISLLIAALELASQSTPQYQQQLLTQILSSIMLSPVHLECVNGVHWEYFITALMAGALSIAAPVPDQITRPENDASGAPVQSQVAEDIEVNDTILSPNGLPTWISSPSSGDATIPRPDSVEAEAAGTSGTRSRSGSTAFRFNVRPKSNSISIAPANLSTPGQQQAAQVLHLVSRIAHLILWSQFDRMPESPESINIEAIRRATFYETAPEVVEDIIAKARQQREVDNALTDAPSKPRSDSAAARLDDWFWCLSKLSLIWRHTRAPLAAIPELEIRPSIPPSKASGNVSEEGSRRQAEPLVEEKSEHIVRSQLVEDKRGGENEEDRDLGDEEDEDQDAPESADESSKDCDAAAVSGQESGSSAHHMQENTVKNASGLGTTATDSSSSGVLSLDLDLLIKARVPRHSVSSPYADDVSSEPLDASDPGNYVSPRQLWLLRVVVLNRLLRAAQNILPGLGLLEAIPTEIGDPSRRTGTPQRVSLATASALSAAAAAASEVVRKQFVILEAEEEGAPSPEGSEVSGHRRRVSSLSLTAPPVSVAQSVYSAALTAAQPHISYVSRSKGESQTQVRQDETLSANVSVSETGPTSQCIESTPESDQAVISGDSHFQVSLLATAAVAATAASAVASTVSPIAADRNIVTTPISGEVASLSGPTSPTLLTPEVVQMNQAAQKESARLIHVAQVLSRPRSGSLVGHAASVASNEPTSQSFVELEPIHDPTEIFISQQGSGPDLPPILGRDWTRRGSIAIRATPPIEDTLAEAQPKLLEKLGHRTSRAASMTESGETPEAYLESLIASGQLMVVRQVSPQPLTATPDATPPPQTSNISLRRQQTGTTKAFTSGIYNVSTTNPASASSVGETPRRTAAQLEILKTNLGHTLELAEWLLFEHPGGHFGAIQRDKLLFERLLLRNGPKSANNAFIDVAAALTSPTPTRRMEMLRKQIELKQKQASGTNSEGEKPCGKTQRAFSFQPDQDERNPGSDVGKNNQKGYVSPEEIELLKWLVFSAATFFHKQGHRGRSHTIRLLFRFAETVIRDPYCVSLIGPFCIAVHNVFLHGLAKECIRPHQPPPIPNALAAAAAAAAAAGHPVGDVSHDATGQPRGTAVMQHTLTALGFARTASVSTSGQHHGAASPLPGLLTRDPQPYLTPRAAEENSRADQQYIKNLRIVITMCVALRESIATLCSQNVAPHHTNGLRALLFDLLQHWDVGDPEAMSLAKDALVIPSTQHASYGEANVAARSAPLPARDNPSSIDAGLVLDIKHRAEATELVREWMAEIIEVDPILAAACRPLDMPDAIEIADSTRRVLRAYQDSFRMRCEDRFRASHVRCAELLRRRRKYYFREAMEANVADVVEWGFPSLLENPVVAVTELAKAVSQASESVIPTSIARLEGLVGDAALGYRFGNIVVPANVLANYSALTSAKTTQGAANSLQSTGSSPTNSEVSQSSTIKTITSYTGSADGAQTEQPKIVCLSRTGSRLELVSSSSVLIDPQDVVPVLQPIALKSSRNPRAADKYGLVLPSLLSDPILSVPLPLPLVQPAAAVYRSYSVTNGTLRRPIHYFLPRRHVLHLEGDRGVDESTSESAASRMALRCTAQSRFELSSYIRRLLAYVYETLQTDPGLSAIGLGSPAHTMAASLALRAYRIASRLNVLPQPVAQYVPAYLMAINTILGENGDRSTQISPAQLRQIVQLFKCLSSSQQFHWKNMNLSLVGTSDESDAKDVGAESSQFLFGLSTMQAEALKLMELDPLLQGQLQKQWRIPASMLRLVDIDSCKSSRAPVDVATSTEREASSEWIPLDGLNLAIDNGYRVLHNGHFPFGMRRILKVMLTPQTLEAPVLDHVASINVQAHDKRLILVEATRRSKAQAAAAAAAVSAALAQVAPGDTAMLGTDSADMWTAMLKLGMAAQQNMSQVDLDLDTATNSSVDPSQPTPSAVSADSQSVSAAENELDEIGITPSQTHVSDFAGDDGSEAGGDVSTSKSDEDDPNIDQNEDETERGSTSEVSQFVTEDDVQSRLQLFTQRPPLTLLPQIKSIASSAANDPYATSLTGYHPPDDVYMGPEEGHKVCLILPHAKYEGSLSITATSILFRGRYCGDFIPVLFQLETGTHSLLTALMGQQGSSQLQSPNSQTSGASRSELTSSPTRSTGSDSVASGATNASSKAIRSDFLAGALSPAAYLPSNCDRAAELLELGYTPEQATAIEIARVRHEGMVPPQIVLDLPLLEITRVVEATHVMRPNAFEVYLTSGQSYFFSTLHPSHEDDALRRQFDYQCEAELQALIDGHVKRYAARIEAERRKGSQAFNEYMNRVRLNAFEMFRNRHQDLEEKFNTFRLQHRKIEAKRASKLVELILHRCHALKRPLVNSKQFPKLYEVASTSLPVSAHTDLSMGPSDNATERWRRGEMSNFDYLMYLNIAAGRSYNDLTQYPVFPWILCDYDSPTIDLSDPRVYRDLTKPVGALNPEKLETYQAKYDSIALLGNHGATEGDTLMKPFFYGSHYSSAGTVLQFLIRLEPFTSLSSILQSGRFDLPDRVFDGVPSAFRSVLTNLGDVRELIPEFFYLPDMFRNGNGIDLGARQTSPLRLGDAVLPNWARTPEEFVRIHRAALESPYVSANLHHWIDLIFGHKQQGKDAVDAKNVFYFLTYPSQSSFDRITDATIRKATLDQIQCFGQCPVQLFTKPHPQRLVQPHHPFGVKPPCPRLSTNFSARVSFTLTPNISTSEEIQLPLSSQQQQLSQTFAPGPQGQTGAATAISSLALPFEEHVDPTFPIHRVASLGVPTLTKLGIPQADAHALVEESRRLFPLSSQTPASLSRSASVTSPPATRTPTLAQPDFVAGLTSPVDPAPRTCVVQSAGETKTPGLPGYYTFQVMYHYPAVGSANVFTDLKDQIDVCDTTDIPSVVRLTSLARQQQLQQQQPIHISGSLPGPDGNEHSSTGTQGAVASINADVSAAPTFIKLTMGTHHLVACHTAPALTSQIFGLTSFLEIQNPVPEWMFIETRPRTSTDEYQTNPSATSSAADSTAATSGPDQDYGGLYDFEVIRGASTGEGTEDGSVAVTDLTLSSRSTSEPSLGNVIPPPPPGFVRAPRLEELDRRQLVHPAFLTPHELQATPIHMILCGHWSHTPLPTLRYRKSAETHSQSAKLLGKLLTQLKSKKLPVPDWFGFLRVPRPLTKPKLPNTASHQVTLDQLFANTPDGLLISSLERIWNTPSGPQPSAQQHEFVCEANETGHYLFVGGANDGSIKCVHLSTGTGESKILGSSTAGHTSVVTAIKLSSDGQWLFSGDTQGKIAVWNVSSCAPHIFANVGTGAATPATLVASFAATVRDADSITGPYSNLASAVAAAAGVQASLGHPAPHGAAMARLPSVLWDVNNGIPPNGGGSLTMSNNAQTPSSPLLRAFSPLPAQPTATSSVAPGRIIAFASNSYCGTFAALAKDVTGARGARVLLFAENSIGSVTAGSLGNATSLPGLRTPGGVAARAVAGAEALGLDYSCGSSPNCIPGHIELLAAIDLPPALSGAHLAITEMGNIVVACRRKKLCDRTKRIIETSDRLLLISPSGHVIADAEAGGRVTCLLATKPHPPYITDGFIFVGMASGKVAIRCAATFKLMVVLKCYGASPHFETSQDVGSSETELEGVDYTQCPPKSGVVALDLSSKNTYLAVSTNAPWQPPSAASLQRLDTGQDVQTSFSSSLDPFTKIARAFDPNASSEGGRLVLFALPSTVPHKHQEGFYTELALRALHARNNLELRLKQEREQREREQQEREQQKAQSSSKSLASSVLGWFRR